jgi:hypothetical protein
VYCISYSEPLARFTVANVPPSPPILFGSSVALNRPLLMMVLSESHLETPPKSVEAFSDVYLPDGQRSKSTMKVPSIALATKPSGLPCRTDNAGPIFIPAAAGAVVRAMKATNKAKVILNDLVL